MRIYTFNSTRVEFSIILYLGLGILTISSQAQAFLNTRASQGPSVWLRVIESRQPRRPALQEASVLSVPEKWFWNPDSPLPSIPDKSSSFWKKPEIQKRMKTEGEIFVSVRRESSSTKEFIYLLRLQGAGWVQVPFDRAFSRVKQFNKYPEITEHIVQTKYNPDAQLLYIRGEAYNYWAEMLMQTEFVERSDFKEMKWRIVGGLFPGMLGSVRLEKISDKETEISLRALYDYNTVPLPSFFLEFGMEVVLRQVAAKMRTFIMNE